MNRRSFTVDQGMGGLKHKLEEKKKIFKQFLNIHFIKNAQNKVKHISTTRKGQLEAVAVAVH